MRINKKSAFQSANRGPRFVHRIQVNMFSFEGTELLDYIDVWVGESADQIRLRPIVYNCPHGGYVELREIPHWGDEVTKSTGVAGKFPDALHGEAVKQKRKHRKKEQT